MLIAYRKRPKPFSIINFSESHVNKTFGLFSAEKLRQKKHQSVSVSKDK